MPVETPQTKRTYEQTIASIACMRTPCDEAALQAERVRVPCKVEARSWILAATILASSMAFIDSTVVNVALPALQASFHATVVDVQWVVESYGLFLGALILVGGSAGDLFGRRHIFVAGVSIFAVASVGCGIAGSIASMKGRPTAAPIPRRNVRRGNAFLVMIMALPVSIEMEDCGRFRKLKFETGSPSSPNYSRWN